MAQTALPAAPATLGQEPRAKPAKSLWSDAWRRLRRSRPAFVSALLIASLAVLAIVHPLVTEHGYAEQNYDVITQPPSREHLLGTDQLGRDILSRLIFGARISLAVGLTVQTVILLIGVPAGLVAGFYGGKIDMLLMRTVDVLYSLPSLLFVIVIMTFLRAKLQASQGGITAAIGALDERTGGLIGVFIGLGLISWLTVARLVRAQTMALKQKEFVEAARSLGATDRETMLRHLLPNTVAVIVVTATLGIPLAILYEAGISFLGLGATPPMPSWGLMISEAIPNLRAYPYMLVSPALALSATVLAFNFLGDGLRDALDPWMRR
ncbi:MAG: ABC transporter permease [Chloroflexia bacterium]|nr:ABC transporter permease [Chloroflexia bacterium]